MDDFGTGYSSLAYLKELSVATLKTDRSFIRNLTQDNVDRTLVSTIISLAHSLERKVVAEGVEEEGQLQFLKEKGCDYAQGYLFSRPVAAKEAGQLLQNWWNFAGKAFVGLEQGGF
ncbi:MAG: EAL domain-containing protein, partial [Magnetococcales bacterium]|nr:EAL domain-containing protein [Magnetococcales bacterium]